MRWKQYKIIRSLTKGPVEWGPGDSRIVAWPAPAPTPMAFGASGGTIGKDLWPAGPDKEDHCKLVMLLDLRAVRLANHKVSYFRPIFHRQARARGGALLPVLPLRS